MQSIARAFHMALQAGLRLTVLWIYEMKNNEAMTRNTIFAVTREARAKGKR